MKIKSRCCKFFAACLLLCLGIVQLRSAERTDETSKALEASIPTDAKINRWEEHVRRWLVETKLSGGIVEDKVALKEKERKGVATSENPPKLLGRQILDNLVTENPHYQWQVVHGAVNVVPKDMTSEPMAVLNKKVKGFHVSSRGAIHAMFALLEHEKFPIGSDPTYAFGGIKPKKIPPVRDFSCADVTVLECMNDFAREDNSFWHIYPLNDTNFILTSSSFAPLRKGEKNP